MLSDDPPILEQSIDWVRVLMVSLGTLSLIGSTFIGSVFIMYKRLRCFAFELVFYLSISCFFSNLSYLIFYIDNEFTIIDNMTLCRIQAFIMIWSETSMMIWASLITYSVYQTVVNFDEVQAIRKTSCLKRFSYIMIGYVPGFLIALFGILMNFFGPCGKWCWVNTKHDDLIADIYSWLIYIFIWGLIIGGSLFIKKIINYLNATFENDQKSLLKKYMCKLIQYPIIQILSLLPSTINRLCYDIFEYKSTPLSIISIIFLSTQGFLFALSYGYNPQIRQALAESLCCKAQEEYYPHSRNSLVSSMSESMHTKHEILI